MKNYRRENPRFSLCGLNCALCPMHLNHYCPGCGGGEGHQPCAIIRCSQQHEGVEYCFMCDAFPCEKYDGVTEYDSFITHRNMVRDLKKAQRMGVQAYQSELDEKAVLLRELLDNYNDGRKKTFYCVAVNLLELGDVISVMKRLASGTDTDAPVKEKAAFAASCFQEIAQKRGIILKLHKKPKKK
ncbi:DUF3795 domain-containing protein [Candidatus Soleaferrea massiliensis]|uniref:DUF3795 domain-containing protein n=1 Tax=Candidatus Soleaferrea massiliensis TaxID=1470354 RepID=UPI00058EDE81|nr:DUF3795 domain-containing protein [Candidatus Soleaferrea massiliensis]